LSFGVCRSDILNTAIERTPLVTTQCTRAYIEWLIGNTGNLLYANDDLSTHTQEKQHTQLELLYP